MEVKVSQMERRGEKKKSSRLDHGLLEALNKQDSSSTEEGVHRAAGAAQ